MAEPGFHNVRGLWSHVSTVRPYEFLARVIAVLSLVAAVEVARPDFSRTVSRTGAAAIAQSGLLLAVDAADTASYSGSGTVWTDLSGNNMHGTLSTTPVVAASTGSTPRSFTTSSGRYASFPAGFSDFTSGLTVQATLDFGSVDTWERVIDFATDFNGGAFVAGDGDNSSNILLSRRGTSTDIVLEFYAARGASPQYLGSCFASGGILSGMHNYAVTVAPGGGSTTCTMYRDGSVISSSNSLSRMPDDVVRTANFAAHSNWTADPDLAGNLKSVFVYNRALSGSEIASNHSADGSPLAPSSLATTSVATTSVALSWSAPTSSGSSSITDYVVEYSLDNSSWTTFADGTSTSTSATVTGLQPGTPHHFRVSAKNASSTGTVSSTVSATTVNTPPTYVSSSVNAAGTQLTVTFSETMSSSVPSGSSFLVKNVGYPNPVTAVTASGSTLVLDLREPVHAGQTVTVAYTDPSGSDDANAAQDAAGLDAASFGAQTVTTNNASNAVPRAARLIGLGTRVKITPVGLTSGIRGITSDGTKVYYRTGTDGTTRIYETNLSSVTLTDGGTASPAQTSWTIGSSLTNNGGRQLVYSSGCLFTIDAAGVLKCISTATRAVASLSAPVGYDFPTANGWMNYDMVGFPDGRIGMLGTETASGSYYTTLLRVYNVVGSGTSATLAWSEDFTLRDKAAMWGDNHGAATDGTYLYRIKYTAGYKVWRLRSGTTSEVVFDGDGSGTCAGSGTFCASSENIMVNPTYMGRDHASGRMIVGDYDASAFYVTEPANPGLSVTYDSQGGSAIPSGFAPVGGSIQSSPGTPTRAGYTFDGWFAASSGGSAVTFPYAHGQTANFTLYAQWTANTLTVSYDSQGGSAIGAGSTVTGGSITSSPGTPTRSNHDFKGWFAASSGGSAISFPYAHGRTASFTLYAQWITNQASLSITGAPVSLAYLGTATLGTSGGSGSGAVSFAVVTPTVCSVDSGSGLVTMLAGSGTCTVSATKAADSDYYSVAAPNISITAVAATQAALTISGSGSGTYGGTVNLTASGGSTGGQVTWSDGASTACSVNGSGSVSITSGTGTCSVTATMAGNSNYGAVTSPAHSITVSRASQSSLTVTSTEAVYGQSLVLTATGGSGSGSVSWARVSGTCTVSTGVLTPGDAGSACVVRATKASDSNYLQKVSADTNVTVSRASQTGFVVTSATSFTTGSTLVLTAAGGQSTGSVSWSLTSGTCTLSGANLTAARGGISCVVEATRAGDVNHLPVSDSVSVTVNRITQTLTFRSAAPSNAVVGGTHTVNVDSDAFLAPVIAVANQSSAVCSVTAGVVTFLAPGTCLVTASQAGTDVYSSASVSQSISVGLSATATTVAAPVPDPGATGPSVPASAVSVPGSATTTTVATGLPLPKRTVTSTTTSTTTTLPPDPARPQTGPDGAYPSLGAGKTSALVRGKAVKVDVRRVAGTLVMTLPNKVTVVFGAAGASSRSVGIGADGVLRMYRRDFVDVRATGLEPGSTYTVYMFSTPVELGRGIVSPDGTVRISVQVPEESEFGEHTVQVNGVGPGSEVVTTSLGFEVLERKSNTGITVLALTLAVLLALLGGRPVITRRRRRA